MESFILSAVFCYKIRVFQKDCKGLTLGHCGGIMGTGGRLWIKVGITSRFCGKLTKPQTRLNNFAFGEIPVKLRFTGFNRVFNFVANRATLTLALLGKIDMFLGEYNHTIDEKKRLAVPTKFRQELGKKAVITRGLDDCLFLFPMKEWEKEAEKISKLPLHKADARGYNRIMLSGAMDVNLDGLGRILVPDYLKKFAGLEKKVVFTGLYNRIEIWDEKKWGIYKETMEKDAENIAERLKELEA